MFLYHSAEPVSQRFESITAHTGSKHSTSIGFTLRLLENTLSKATSTAAPAVAHRLVNGALYVLQVGEVVYVCWILQHCTLQLFALNIEVSLDYRVNICTRHDAIEYMREKATDKNTQSKKLVTSGVQNRNIVNRTPSKCMDDSRERRRWQHKNGDFEVIQGSKTDKESQKIASCKD